MPQPRRRRSNSATAEPLPRSEVREERDDRETQPPPPPRQGQSNGTPDTHRNPDESEYTGRDWRDDQGGRGAPSPSDTDRDRRDSADGAIERPAHAGAGPGSTVGRSSSWGPVLSGAATAFVVFLVFSALWVAIAASGSQAIGDNLAWFQLVSGILAAAAGGAAAGWLDPRGTLTGMIQGLSTWGLLVLATTVAGLTTGTALLGAVGDVTLDASIEAANVTEMLQPFEMELWALFAVLLGGALIAALAGALTGRAHTMLALDDLSHREESAYDRSHDTAADRSPARTGTRQR